MNVARTQGDVGREGQFICGQCAQPFCTVVGSDGARGCLVAVACHGTCRSVRNVLRSIRAGDDAVPSKTSPCRTSQTLSNGQGWRMADSSIIVSWMPAVVE